MQLSKIVIGLMLAGPLAGVANAQTTSGPTSNPTAPAPRSESDFYVPLYGVTAGIAIPVGRLSDDHAAGYLIGGVIEYKVSGQPYSLRGEALYQRFALKEGHAGDDVNLLSLGTTIVSAPGEHGADVRQRRHRDLQRDEGRHAAGLQRRHRHRDSAHRVLGGCGGAAACDARGWTAGDDVAADRGRAILG